MFKTKKHNKKLTNSAFSEFVRNASSREKKKVFKAVLEEANREQERIIEEARRNRINSP